MKSNSSFFKYILLIVLLHWYHFFSPLYPSALQPPAPSRTLSCYFMSMGHTYKFFGFPISYTILKFPLPIFYLPLCFLFPVPFPPFYTPISADNPPCDLHFCDPVPVLVVCLVCFYFSLLCSIIDSCELVVILLFTV